METAEYYWLAQARAAGHLDCWVKDYFNNGLTIHHVEDGSTVIAGKFPDLSAVYGFILRLRDAGLVLLFLQVERIENQLPRQGK